MQPLSTRDEAQSLQDVISSYLRVPLSVEQTLGLLQAICDTESGFLDRLNHIAEEYTSIAELENAVNAPKHLLKTPDPHALMKDTRAYHEYQVILRLSQYGTIRVVSDSLEHVRTFIDQYNGPIAGPDGEEVYEELEIMEIIAQ